MNQPSAASPSGADFAHDGLASDTPTPAGTQRDASDESDTPNPLPMSGLRVIDVGTFLAGPYAASMLGEFGAEVLKVEHPIAGDPMRRFGTESKRHDATLAWLSEGRNKKSVTLDLRQQEGVELFLKLVAKSDVLIENFRPGVMKKLGLGFEAVQPMNPNLIYGTVTGYGSTGPWAGKPGQDLLAQSMSGLAWLSGNADQGPVPMGLAIADLTCSAHLVEGVLACLVRRGITGAGGRVEVSLLESILDLQFEVITTHLNDGGRTPERSAVNNGHAYLGAPYGIYATADGHLALAMGVVPRLGELLGCAPSIGEQNVFLTAEFQL